MSCPEAPASINIPLEFPSGEVIEIHYQNTIPLMKLTKQFTIPFTALMDEAYGIAFEQAQEQGVTLYRGLRQLEIVSHRTDQLFTLHYMTDRQELFDITIEPI